jgi:hypothetical protein
VPPQYPGGGTGPVAPSGGENSGWMAQANNAAGVNVPMTGAQQGPGASTDPPILWGYENVRQQFAREPGELGGGRAPALGPTVRKPKWMTMDEAKLNIYTWSEKQLDQLAQRLIDAGILSPDYTRAELISKWLGDGGLVDQAGAFTAAGKPKTPWDVISWMGGGGKPGPPEDKVSKQVHISTPEQARAILRDVAAARLGHSPTERQIDDFQAQLNQAQRANPFIETTSYDDQGHPTTTQSGGIAPEQFGQDYIEENFGAEADDYDTVSRLIPAMYQAIFTPI